MRSGKASQLTAHERGTELGCDYGLSSPASAPHRQPGEAGGEEEGGPHSRVETRRYAHLSDDPVREASERIGAKIAAALDGKPPAEVVPLRGG